MYPKSVIDNQIKTFLDKQFTVVSGTTSEKKKLRHISERFSKDIDINIAFLPLKLSSFFSCMVTIPKFLQSYAVYQFTFIGCKIYYIVKTKRHLTL